MSATPSAPPHRIAQPAAFPKFGREIHEDGGGWSMEWQLKRNCSMAPMHLLMIYLCLSLVSLSIASVFWWQGARMVMPFAWLEVLVVGICMWVYARHASDHESIALLPGSLRVAQASGQRVTQVEFEPRWVRVESLTADRSLIELSGQGRRIAIGRFVRPELRAQLAGELRRAVRLAQTQ